MEDMKKEIVLDEESAQKVLEAVGHGEDAMLLWMATIMMLNAGIQGMVINWLALAAAFIGAQVTLFAAQY